METRANYVLIGIFTLAVVFGAFAFVWWIERVGDMGGRANYEIVFDSSVSGLRPGAPVNFNGIRVGEVSALRLDKTDPRKVVVTVGLAASVPIRSDTRASLEYQGLTGIASVAMTGGRMDAPPLVAQAGAPPRMLAEGGQIQDLMTGAKQIMGRIDSIAMRIDRLLGDNEDRLDQAIKDISQFTSVLSARSQDADTLISNAAELAAKLNKMADRFDSVLTSVQGFTGDKENQGFMANASSAAKSVRELADSLSKSAPSALREYHALAVDARRTVGEIERVVRNLERNPGQFLFGGGASSSGGVPEYNPR
ncbi:MAG: MlaD family protein [Xanthobacteraceae bacterium]|jgi:phospholipid/cholesterol/gamma-HCH transport system substrate-binding protein